MPLEGYEKAAVFLRSIGEDTAAEIMKSLEIRDISKITTHMTKLVVGKSDIEDVFKDAIDKITGGEVYGGGGDYIRRVLLKVVGEDKTDRILDMIGEDGPIDSIRDVDPKALANFLILEHPQTIALAMSLLEPHQAALVLTEMPDKLRADVTLRVAITERIPANAVEELEKSLMKLDSSKGKGTKFGGLKTAAEILNQAERSLEQQVLESIEESDSDVADAIRQLMFVFEDLVGIDDRSMQQILKEVTTEDLVVALKTASGALKERILGNMSKRASGILKEEMDIKGPVRITEVEKAQQAIVRVARKLEAEGRIVLAGKGEEFVE